MNRERSAAHAVKEEIRGVVVFIGIIWAVFVLDGILVWILDWELSRQFALMPRSFGGATGILAMPFLHRDFSHILSNTLPLFILLTLLAGSDARSWAIVATLIVANGVLLWLFGSATNATGQLVQHVGASGLVFALVGYLIGSGLFERRLIPMVVAVIVGLMFGGMVVQGLVPQPEVSWGGHFFGLLAGIGLAYMMARESTLTRDGTAASRRVEV